jgi:hypothetical protein
MNRCQPVIREKCRLFSRHIPEFANWRIPTLACIEQSAGMR